MKYIMTSLLIGVIILSIACYFLYSRVVTLEKIKTTLESEKITLETTIERYKNAEVEASKTINELRKISQNSKVNNDWYNVAIPLEFIDLLQKRHNRTIH